MMFRYRWYEIRLPKGLQQMTRQLDTSPLHAGSSSGFLLLQKEKLTATYKFIWRETLTSTGFDEEGVLVYQKFNTVNFIDIGFFEVGGKYFLRAENPTRSLRELMNSLESIIGTGFTSSAVIFNGTYLLDLVAGWEKKILVGLKISGAVYGKDLVSRVEFASKTGIVPDSIDILKNIKYTIDSATYELTYEGVKGQLSISSNGLVKISGQLSARVLHSIEGGISKFR